MEGSVESSSKSIKKISVYCEKCSRIMQQEFSIGWDTMYREQSLGWSLNLTNRGCADRSHGKRFHLTEISIEHVTNRYRDALV